MYYVSRADIIDDEYLLVVNDTHLRNIVNEWLSVDQLSLINRV